MNFRFSLREQEKFWEKTWLEILRDYDEEIDECGEQIDVSPIKKDDDEEFE